MPTDVATIAAAMNIDSTKEPPQTDAIAYPATKGRMTPRTANQRRPFADLKDVLRLGFKADCKQQEDHADLGNHAQQLGWLYPA